MVESYTNVAMLNRAKRLQSLCRDRGRVLWVGLPLLGGAWVGAAPAIAHPAWLIPPALVWAQTTPASPSSEAVYLMQLGDTGPGVESIQRKLQTAGYYDGAITGTYDAATEAAVRWLQSVVELPVTGGVDFATWRAIQASLPQSAPAPPPEATTTEPETAAAATPAVTEPADTEPADTESAAAPPPAAPLPLDDASPPSAARLSWPRLFLWGAIAASGSVAVLGSLLYLLRLWRSHRQSPAPAPAIPPTGASGDPSAPPTVTLPTESSPPTTPDPLLSATVPVTTSGALQSPTAPTSRLQRINIVEELLDQLDSPDPALRRKVIWELGQRGNPQAIQPLVNLMLQSDSRQRSLILAALSAIGGQTLQPMGQALAISLQDPNPDVRKNAIRDLTRVYDAIAQVGPLLQQATADPDPEVQATAQWALRHLQDMRPTLPPDSIQQLQGWPPAGHDQDVSS